MLEIKLSLAKSEALPRSVVFGQQHRRYAPISFRDDPEFYTESGVICREQSLAPSQRIIVRFFVEAVDLASVAVLMSPKGVDNILVRECGYSAWRDDGLAKRDRKTGLWCGFFIVAIVLGTFAQVNSTSPTPREGRHRIGAICNDGTTSKATGRGAARIMAVFNAGSIPTAPAQNHSYCRGA